VSSVDHGKNLASLMKKLRSRYEAPEPVERQPMEHFLYAYLLWEASVSKAEAAIKRVMHHVVDFNELRVCRPPELVSLLGKTYPRAEERALRIRATLQDLYVREYEVSLAAALAMNKRDAKKYIETLEGLPPFVSARVLLTVFGAHAIPVDDRTLQKLIAAEVAEPGSDVTKAMGILERHIKAEEAAEAHALLQAWSEDSASDPTARSSKDRGSKKSAGEPRGTKSAKNRATSKA
jgi:endonuclease III